MAAPLAKLAKGGTYHPEARIFQRGRLKARRGARVAVLCAGTSDLNVAEEAAVTAAALGCQVEAVTSTWESLGCTDCWPAAQC